MSTGTSTYKSQLLHPKMSVAHFQDGAWNFGFSWAETITTQKDLVLNHLGVFTKPLALGVSVPSLWYFYVISC